MSSDFELAKSEMEKLLGWAEANDANLHRNEADTRLHLIDQLLFSCLGWGREDCHSEERFAGEYTDYSFGSPRRLVIEAKREGIYFELPVGFDKRVCKLATIIDCSPQIASAIVQALRYCQDRGIPFGMVSNGHQLIAFIGPRYDGIPPLDGRCIVFAGLEDMVSDFQILWDNLSKNGVLAYTLHSTLMADGIQPPPAKLSQRIPDFPGFKNRNSFQTDLKILGDLFIEDVIRAPQLEADFLEKCYSPSGALSQYALISKQILETRYSKLFEKELAGPTLEPGHTKRGVSAELVSDVLAAGLKRRAIVLLGDVGVGKTIFIRHLIRVSARAVFEKAIALYVDFGKEPALAEDLEGFILRKCAGELLEEHDIDIEENNFVRGVYHSELSRFAKGIYGPLAKTDLAAYMKKEVEFLNQKVQEKAGHLRACLVHISKAHRRQIVVFLDNVDQRTSDFQDRVFVIGQSLAETWPATVFISMRPDTFFHSKAEGSLAAYEPRVFTISPPRVDNVIDLRLRFVLSQLRSTGTFTSLPSAFSINPISLAMYIEVLVDSFKNSRPLVEFIDNLSGGNIRRALSFVTTFIGSGHVDADKIINIVEENGAYIIPIHEFMRAVIYGDLEHYPPSVSPVVNLFDISTPDGREHFLLANILAFIHRVGALPTKEGYVDAISIYDACQALGFSPSQIEFALNRARNRRLVDTVPRFSEGPASSYRITASGAYTFAELPKHFAYVDAMIVDTPIVDAAVRSVIGDSSRIQERLVRMDHFRQYLDFQHRTLTSTLVTFDWPTASLAIDSRVQKIREIETRKETSRRLSSLGR